MISKQKSKEKILELIQNYSKNQNNFKNISETDTRIKFIDRLLEYLGWDVFGKDLFDEVQREESTKSKKLKLRKIDYTLKINGISKVVIEAKSLKEDLDNDIYIKQSVEYAYNKACSWAILTNFREIKIFYVDREEKFSPFYRIKLEYIDNFDQNFDILWSISKKGVEEGILDKEVKRRGIKKSRIPVNQQLFSDLTRWREIFSKDIRKKYPDQYTSETIDEIVQRIIDRIIFIRKAEDSELEERKLDQLIRRFNKNTYDELKKIFLEYNDKYNSKLFGENKQQLHESDVIEINNEVIEEVIKSTYRPRGSTLEYNFDVIGVDVLGNIYEQYLAYILTKTPKRTKLKGGKAHRKEQGIYYTPNYIVDYIVRNTIGELVKKQKNNIDKIKILDPACGSGSFLIKAFDYLVAYHSKKGKISQTKLDFSGVSATYSKKVDIVKNNIYGVDLDPKAVEIAQLNLLLKIAERGRRLPVLRKNIKCGNSLINDEKISEEFFKWKDEFKDIMTEGGFDIAIGNPPWSSKISKTENKLIARKIGLSEKNINICSLFIIESLKKIKNGGFFGFLLPKVVIKNKIYVPIRKEILENYNIKEIVDFGQFPGVASDAIALIIEKSKKKTKTKITFFEDNKIVKQNKIDQKIFHEIPSFVFSLSITPEIYKIIRKINKNSYKLGNLFKIKRGIELGQRSKIVKCDKCGFFNEAGIKYYGSSGKKCKSCNSKLNLENSFSITSENKTKKYERFCVSGTQVKRYTIEDNYFIPKNLEGINYKTEAFKGNKILIKRISTKIEGTFTDRDLLAFNTVYSIYSKKLIKDEFLYTLGILNSKLIHFFYEFSYNVGMNLTTQVTIDFLSKIPIKKGTSVQRRSIIGFVQKILDLNKKISDIENKKTDEKRNLLEKTSFIQNKIDSITYKIYGVSEKEKQIIKKSLNYGV